MQINMTASITKTHLLTTYLVLNNGKSKENAIPDKTNQLYIHE